MLLGSEQRVVEECCIDVSGAMGFHKGHPGLGIDDRPLQTVQNRELRGGRANVVVVGVFMITVIGVLLMVVGVGAGFVMKVWGLGAEAGVVVNAVVVLAGVVRFGSGFAFVGMLVVVPRLGGGVIMEAAALVVW